MFSGWPSSRARSRQLGQTAYFAPQADGKRGASFGLGTTVQRNAGVGESCKSPRGTAIGFPFTSTTASAGVSFKIRSHAGWGRAHLISALGRAHWNVAISAPRALRGRGVGGRNSLVRER